MPSFAANDLNHLLSAYGYWAVFALVLVECLGVPVPGETVLLAAAIYAGTTGRLSIALVIVAAATAAIAGSAIGFWVGQEGGFRLLARYGTYVRLDERKLKLGQYLFLRHGGKVVFFGRFVAVLRAWAAFLAGANRMRWRPFLLANVGGALVWAAGYGLLGYGLGNGAQDVRGRAGLAIGVAAAAVIGAVLIFLWKNEKRLEEEAVRALPGPLRETPHRPISSDTRQQ